MPQRLLLVVHRAEIEHIKSAAARLTFVKMVSLAQRRPADLLADDFPRGNGGAGKSAVSSSIRMARGCQYYCPQGGEVVAQVRNCLAFPPRLGQPRLGRGNPKTRIWELWCFAPRWLAVRQVLLTSHRLTSRRKCIKHTRVRNLHRKHRLFRREQLRYPALLPCPTFPASRRFVTHTAFTGRQ
jgi:hypothetical protein